MPKGVACLSQIMTLMTMDRTLQTLPRMVKSVAETSERASHACGHRCA